MNIHDTNALKIHVVSPVACWIGIGFGKSGMTNVDMNVIEFKNNGGYSLVDMYSKGKFRPKTDEDLGGTNDLYDAQYSFTDKYHSLTYKRKLVTDDEYDFNIPLVC